ncbi:MAG: hypothetical protein IKC72_00545 [Clostridia bacterium]|nr:hypothetical protein [Clostridia bacterium]
MKNLLQLRIGTAHHNDPAFIKELLELLDETRTFDEIWMATDYGLCSLDEIQKHIPNMRKTAEEIRRHGIIASMQISRTIGHAPTLMKTQSTKGMENAKYDFIRFFDGKYDGGRICYSGDDFRAYVHDAMREWGKVGADIVWVDDDVRLWSNGRGILCFCDTCIRKFNEKYGYQFHFDSLKNAFLSDNDEVRENYRVFQIESLAQFARIISESIHDSSPDSVMALQQGGRVPIAAQSQEACLDAMYEVTGKNPPCRVGGGFYADHDPSEMLVKAMKINFMISRLPDYVSLRTTEIENLPFVSYGKSVECSALEAALYMAYGANAASVTMMNNLESLSYHRKIFEKLSLYRPYYEAVTAHNGFLPTGGLTVYQPKTPHLSKMKDAPDNTWYDEVIYEGIPLMRLGIPVNVEPEGDIYFLSAKAAAQVREADMETLLRSPVILTGEALRKLCELGYRDLIGADAHPVADQYKMVTYDLPCEHSITDGFPNFRYSDSYYFCKDTQFLIEGEGIEPIYEAYSSQYKTRLGTSVAVVTTKYGARWFVKGRALANPVVPTFRRDMLIRAMNYISDKPFATYVKSVGQVACVPRVDEQGKVVSVTVLNVSISECEDIELAISNPIGRDARIVDPYLPEKKASLEKLGEYFTVKIGNLAPWRVRTVLIDKE